MDKPKFCVGEEVIAHGRNSYKYDSDRVEITRSEFASNTPLLRRSDNRTVFHTGWIYQTANAPENFWWLEKRLKKLPPKRNAFEDMMEELKTPTPELLETQE